MEPRLTNSRMATFRQCPRKHWYRYELRIRRVREADALAFGKLYHKAHEECAKAEEAGHDYTDATAHGLAALAPTLHACPPWLGADEHALMLAQVSVMFEAHRWRWQADAERYLSQGQEEQFDLPIHNPATGRPSKLYRMAGKIDRQMIDSQTGDVLLREYKTTSDAVDADSPLWSRLAVETQPSHYLLARLLLTGKIDGMLYDVIRKPSIRPKKGESLHEYAARLWADMTSERPDFYFARRVIYRTRRDLDDYAAELWQQAHVLREAQLHDRHYRAPSKWNCDGCEYRTICHGNLPLDPLPDGYTISNTAHPELDDE